MPMQFFDPPPLRYMGSKWKLADFITGFFPPHTIYIEPYCGSASVFFRKHPSEIEVLNDLNQDIINFFDVLRNQTETFIRAVELTPFSYLEYQRSFEPSDDPLERARRFYVRSWQSFGAAGVTRKSGWRRLVSPNRRVSAASDFSRLDGLWLAARRLKDAQIDSLSALDCIARYDQPKALFYIDPPYTHDSRKSESSRYVYEMDDEDHEILAAALHKLKGMVVLSGYESPLYRELYADWKCFSKAATTNGNYTATEYLWISPRAADMHRLPLFDGLRVEH